MVLEIIRGDVIELLEEFIGKKKQILIISLRVASCGVIIFTAMQNPTIPIQLSFWLQLTLRKIWQLKNENETEQVTSNSSACQVIFTVEMEAPIVDMAFPPDSLAIAIACYCNSYCNSYSNILL